MTTLRLTTRIAALLVLLGTVRAGDEKTVTVTDKDDNTRVKLSRGDTLVVKLPVQSGTGYTWQVARVKEGYLKTLGKPEFEKPARSVPGAKVTQVFRFRAEARGAAALELEYRRPFEKDKAPARTVKFQVAVD